MPLPLLLPEPWAIAIWSGKVYPFAEDCRKPAGIAACCEQASDLREQHRSQARGGRGQIATIYRFICSREILIQVAFAAVSASKQHFAQRLRVLLLMLVVGVAAEILCRLGLARQHVRGCDTDKGEIIAT